MFYDKFRCLCDQKGISVSKAAADIGLSNSTPTKWKKTGAVPDSKTMARVSKYFNVPIAFLMGETDDPGDFSKTHWAEAVYEIDAQKERASIQEDGRKPKLASIARLEEGDITPEMDKNITAYIDFILKREKGEE